MDSARRLLLNCYLGFLFSLWYTIDFVQLSVRVVEFCTGFDCMELFNSEVLVEAIHEARDAPMKFVEYVQNTK